MRSAAERYWREEAAERVAFSTVTMLGLVRVLTCAPIMGGRPVEPADAWSVLQTWLTTGPVVRLHEPEGCRARLTEMATAGLVTGRSWTDAYLAAFAIAARVRLVTFDAGFTCFSGLDLLQLAA